MDWWTGERSVTCCLRSITRFEPRGSHVYSDCFGSHTGLVLPLWESRVLLEFRELLESRELHPGPCAAPAVSSLVSLSGKAEIVGSLVSSGDP